MALSTIQSLEVDNQTLRAENQALRENQVAHNIQQVRVDAYQQSQVRFRTVFDHSPLGQKIIDPDLIIRQANTALVTLLGLASPLELIGHTILEFAHPDYRADWAHLQVALWAHHLPFFTLETCLLRANGTVLWCRITSVLFPDDKRELGYTTLEDISDRKQFEALAQQHADELRNINEELSVINEELQVSNEELLESNTTLSKLNLELDTFVYAASHDLRTPISNLEGLVQALLLEWLAGPQQQEVVQPILEMMRESMARFGHTLDRLASFGTAQILKGLDWEYVDVSSVLEEVRQEVAPLLITTQGQLEVELVGTPNLWFATKHTHSVLLNLVSNALKYCHPDRPPVVRVRSYRERGRFVVSVQDNGLGLNETQQGQLFRLFKRLHPHIEGTGMGLYLIKKILDNAGGSIQVTSELGRGSTFTAIFPA